MRNFLYDYQSLIYVEKDNFIISESPVKPKEYTIHHFGNFEAEANIQIEDSKFTDSSFRFGMIYVPPIPEYMHHQNDNKIEGSTEQNIVYQHQYNQPENSQKAIEEIKEKAIKQKQLIVVNSEFQNLNYGKAEHAQASLKRSENLFSQSKGIVCSITDFEGRVEFINNTISKNMVFIPSAIFSNSQKFNASLIDPAFTFFASDADQALGRKKGAYREFGKNETQTLHHFVHVLNYLDPMNEHDILRDNYTSQSAIYLKSSKGSHIIFENNTFDSNIGIHGGAIQVDNSQFSRWDASSYLEYSPFLYLKNNTFTRNMAYLEGNAVYIKGAQQ